MAEQTPVKAKRPTGNAEGVTVAQGMEKAPKQGEVSGHGPFPANYICWSCGAINFVPGGAYAFYCWRCWVYNLAP